MSNISQQGYLHCQNDYEIEMFHKWNPSNNNKKMNKLYLPFLILVLVLNCCHSQTNTTNQTAQMPSSDKSYNLTYLNQFDYLYSQKIFCKVYNTTSSRCVQCVADWGIILDSNLGRCILRFPVWDCYGFDINMNCQLCYDGYFIKYGNITTPNLCYSKRDNCTTYDQTKKRCIQCDYGFALNTTANPLAKTDSEGFCYFITDKNCLQYDTRGYTCLTCASNFLLSAGKCIGMLPNCASMNGTVCQKCITNYEVNSLGQCALIARISDCSSQTDYTCISCNNGYKLVNNQCIFIIDNCFKVSALACSQCNSGYYVNTDGKCSLIPKILNCDIQADFTCQKCLTSYLLSNNQCIFTLPNCAENDGKVCTKCNTDYLINLSGQCQFVPRITNCMTQASTTCYSCNSGFDLINNLCIYHIDNCLKVTDNLCSQCVQRYTVTADGKCTQEIIVYDPNCKLFDTIVFGKCLECSKGFYLNTKSLCQQVDPLCKTYTTNNGFCLSCYVGYTVDLSAGKCYKTPANSQLLENCNQFDYTKNICAKCAQGCSFDEFGKCKKFNDLNCKVPNKDLKSCAECYQGYYFNTTQSKCILGNFNCATWKNGKCDTCPTGYYLNEFFNCTQVDSLCMLFNPMIKMCLLCYPGYSLDTDKTCKQMKNLSTGLQKYNLNCARFNQKSQCMLCYNGYYLTQDTTSTFCDKVSDLCKTYSMTTGKCTSCYLGYYMTTKGECFRYF